MTDSYSRLSEHFRKIHRLDHAITFLSWDHMVMMPPGGNEGRSNCLAELAEMRHALLTSPLIPDLLQELTSSVTDPLSQKSIMEMDRTYQQAACLPADLVRAKTLAGARCEHGWRSQRQENDWPGFLVNFKEVVSLSRDEAQARFDHGDGKFATPYDALLDLYCTGDDSTFISSIFTELKQKLPDLLNAILEKQSAENFTKITGHFPIERQLDVNRELMELLGFDFSCGRLDVSAHPFSTGCHGDQRITTRFRETEFLEALLATAHESGHAAYESGLPEVWEGLPIGSARNLCIHESQSLLFEKQIFLSRSFLSFFHPIICQSLAAAPSAAMDLWRSATRVRPSFIRVEADEVTYPLHVILRFEIEKDLINGHLKTEQIPDLWDEKMQKLLGLSTAGNYTDGCLQDMHWSDGSFGYFPSYTIRATNSSQLFTAIRRDHKDWEKQLASGDISFIREWLREKVWSKGSSLESQEIIEQATGEKTTPRYFLEHLEKRYLEEAF